MATSSYMTFLMAEKDGVGGSYEKLVDIKDFPDIGGEPSTLDTSTLSDFVRTSILGIQDLSVLPFTCNYDLEMYKKIKKMEGKQHNFGIWFGGTGQGSTLTPTGSDGKFKFRGELTVYANGAGVGEVRNMTVSIAASTPIELDETE